MADLCCFRHRRFYPASESVKEHNDLRYADRSERNVLDLYLPEGVAKPPLVVWIHGGAFRMGDKSKPAPGQAPA